MMRDRRSVSAILQAARFILVAGGAAVIAGAITTATLPVAFAAGPREVSDTRKPAAPRRVPDRFIIKEKVERILLDVRVASRKGEPMRGLTPGDFTLRLDGRLWPVLSADEICTSGRASGPAFAPDESIGPAGRAAPGETKAGDTGGTEPGATADHHPKRHVLYFDFSGLGQDGRLRARKAAIRWLREVHRPGELFEVAAYSLRAGMKVLLPWSDDAVGAENVVRGAFTSREFLDGYPAAWHNRFTQCKSCVMQCVDDYSLPVPECANKCSECVANARSDYSHTRSSLRALKHYLTFLSETPGSKSMILFTQNAVYSPGRFYFLEDPDDRVGTHRVLMEELGAVATESRVSFYPVHSGNNQFNDSDFSTVPRSNRASVGFASLLAEYTGGDFSRGPSDTFRVLSDAGRESGCIYRLAFRPPTENRDGVYRAVVRAAGRRVPWTYRVHHVSEAEQVMRKARTLLAGVARDDSLEVVAALRPVRARGRRWDVELQVSLNPSNLEGLPVGDRQHSRLDVGGLLEDVKRGKSWELVGGSKISRSPGSFLGTTLLYSRVLENLKPGEYRLRVFVTDRLMEQAGRGEVAVNLPRPGRKGFLGPLPSLPGKAVFQLNLPYAGEDPEPAGLVVEAKQASAPMGRAPVRRGEPVQMTSWICSSDEFTGEHLVRYIERDGIPVFQMPLGWSEETGACTRVTDVIHTVELTPGLYTYRMAWRRDGDREPRNASRPVAFTIREKAAALDRVRRASQ